ncbi:MAG: hypothetical protein HS115_15070 [Spirochaetales bacterium]|nr:hypothetical protein [Spirochaetales bacterium]
MTLPFDRRAAALILYHGLAQELGKKDQEISDLEARLMIVEALKTLPGLQLSLKNEKVALTNPATEETVAMSLDAAAEALRIIWNEFQSEEDHG